MFLYMQSALCQRNQELTQRSPNGIDELGAVGDVSSTFAFKCQNHLRDKAERDCRGVYNTDRIHCLVCRNHHPCWCVIVVSSCYYMIWDRVTPFF